MINMVIFELAHMILVLRRSMNALTRLCIFRAFPVPSLLGCTKSQHVIGKVQTEDLAFVRTWKFKGLTCTSSCDITFSYVLVHIFSCFEMNELISHFIILADKKFKTYFFINNRTSKMYLYRTSALFHMKYLVLEIQKL